MDELKRDLEVLKSWGIESVPVDKLMSMIEETKDDISVSSERRDMRVPSEVVDAAPATDSCTRAQTSSEVANALPVGGTILYIDDTFDETVWTWSYYSQHWFSYIKYDEASVFFIRAF